MNDYAVKDLVLFRVSAEEPLLEVGRIEAVVFGDLIAVRIKPFPPVDLGGDRVVLAMVMQFYPLDADRLVEAGNLYLRGIIGAARPLADREAIPAPLHLLGDGLPLVVVASDGVLLAPIIERFLEAGGLTFPAMCHREHPRQRDDDFLLFHSFSL